jgi:cyclic beta-1,2-glucan synthetase
VALLRARWRHLAKQLESVAAAPPATLAALQSCLERLASTAGELADQFVPSRDGVGDTSSASEEAELPAEWAEALARQCRTALDELALLTPWVLLSEPPRELEVASLAAIAEVPTLRGLARLDAALSASIGTLLGAATTAGQRAWLADLQRQIRTGSARARDRLTSLERLAVQAGDLARMEYDFLFDKTRHLLAIGYNADDRRVDASYYDLLASEARLCCFVGIAQGQLPQESWFALGRLLTSTSGEPVLLSWSGSMFEYLMPLLVMPTYEQTLLDQTCKAAVARQIEYGNHRGVPWGISESGYNTVDVQLNYQYRAFGVPGLGLKRGLADDLVIAPYASALALMVAPEEACRNLQRLAEPGFHRQVRLLRGDRLYTGPTATRAVHGWWSGRSWLITRG